MDWSRLETADLRDRIEDAKDAARHHNREAGACERVLDASSADMHYEALDEVRQDIRAMRAELKRREATNDAVE